MTAVADILDLFDGAELLTPAEPTPGVELRSYQEEAVARVFEELMVNRSTLLVMATGTGKTSVFARVAHQWPGRVLILAHREELLGQAKERLELMTGEAVDIEQADFHAGLKTRIVVGSVQSLRKARLQSFDAGHFGLVIVDEAHHTPAASYKAVLDHFKDSKVLGVTATPDRGDKKALGQQFDSVAFVFDIEAGIGGGWLSPIVAETVHIDSVSLAAVRTTAGDLNAGDLDAIMATEENIQAVVKPCLERCGDRPTIVFTTGVATAHRMSEVFNRYRNGCAAAVDGGTEKEARRLILRGFKQRDFQFLINVGIATEGFDAPYTSAICIARPTKSRALYAQMAGRGLRVAPGKRDCLLLDISGNAGRHSLISAVDILGGRYTEEERDRARIIIRGKELEPADVAQALEQAREEAEEAQREMERRRAEDAARRLAAKAEVKYRVTKFDPFKVLDIANDNGRDWGRAGQEPVTMAQLDKLKRFGCDVPPGGINKAQASTLIDSLIERAGAKLCTYKQARELQRRGVNTANLSFVKAQRMITALAANNWKNLPLEQFMAMAND